MWSPSPALRAGADKTKSFSRRAQAPESCSPRLAHHHAEKPLLPVTKRGKRSAERRTKCFPHRAFRCRHLKMLGADARLASLLPRLRGEAGRGRARLSAPRRGTRQGCHTLTRLGSAFPGITGCRREDPPRRQCSELLADRPNAPADRFPSRPKAKCVAPPAGTAPAPPSGAPS